MHCHKAQMMINQQLDGQLDQDLSARLVEHLQQCPSCRLQYEQLTKVDQLLKEQFTLVEPPVDFAVSVMAALPDIAIPTSDHVVPLFKRVNRLQRYVLSAAATVMMLVGISYFGFGGLLVADNDQNTPPINTAQTPNTPANTVDQPITPDTSLTQPQDQTVDVAVGNEDTTTQNDSDVNTTPQNTQATDTDTPQQSVVEMPKVAYNSQVSGSFSLQVLAEHEGHSAIYPKTIDGQTVQYYVKVDGGYQLWQQTLSADMAPVMIQDNISALPVVGAATTQTNDVFSEDGSKVVALSPDGSMVAANVYKDAVALWLSDNYSDAEPYVLTHKAGGKILVWSPNSGKIAYTDAAGNLFVAYPSENITFLVYEGVVKSVCWDQNSNALVFSAKTGFSDYTGIYKVIVP